MLVAHKTKTEGRPFTTVEEVDAVKNKEVIRKDGLTPPGGSYMIVDARMVGGTLFVGLLNHTGFGFLEAERLFNNFQFTDSTPCGVTAERK